MKKIVSLVLSVLMVLTIVPLSSFPAFAENVETGTCGDSLIWSLNMDTGELVISGTGSMYSLSFMNDSNIKNVKIGAGVTNIGDSSFCDCANLESIEIPSTVKEIETNFAHCLNLKNINVDKNNKYYSSFDGVLYRCSSTCLAYYPGGRTETEYTVNEKASEIDSDAFISCANLKTVKLPESVRIVRPKAFGQSLTDLYVYGYKCVFEDKSVSKNIVIHSYKTAKAYDYAKKNGNTFEEIICEHKSMKKVTTRASVGHNGYIENVCLDCGKRVLISTIYAIKSVQLTTSAYTYSGAVRTPGVVIKDSKGKTLKKNTDYTVSYASGRKSIGKYLVRVTYKGNYGGTSLIYFTINPKGTKINSLSKPARGQIKVNFSKQTSQTTGYQIQYCRSKTFKSGVKMLTLKKNTYTSYTVKGLPRNTGYYFRIRTFKTIGKTHYYSSWSAYKGAKTK